MAEPERFELEVPAAPDFLTPVRLFVAALARHYGCDEALVEDLKLAVSEVGALAVEDTPSEAKLRIEARHSEGVLEVGITCDDTEFDVWLDPPGTKGDDPRLELIWALFPDVAVSRTDGSPTWITFTIPLSAGASANR